MSGSCGHGWGWHYDGASGPCYRCYETELEKLKTYKEIKAMMSDVEVDLRIAQIEDQLEGKT